jgi:hypothetical protein
VPNVLGPDEEARGARRDEGREFRAELYGDGELPALIGWAPGFSREIF